MDPKGDFKPEAIEAIFAPRTNEHGTHRVTNYAGIHFKISEVNELCELNMKPGIEYAIDSLNKIIADQGSTPSALIKIYWNQQSYLIQASRTVVGENLLAVLDKAPQTLAKLDSYDFSANVISSILTRPGDGKPDNYIVKEEEGSFKIVNIDQDLGFTDAIIQSPSGQHYLGTKVVLYGFPHMLKPLDARFRAYLAQQTAASLLLDWLKDLLMQNAYYKTLQGFQLLTKQEYQSLQLPIRWVPGTLKRLYHQLQTIITLCQSNQPLTLMDILQQLEVLLAAHYANPSANLLEWYAELIRKPIEASKALLASYTNREWDYEEKRSQTVLEAIEELMTAIDYSKLNIKEQQEILMKLAMIPGLSSLTFKRCEITDGDLQQLAQSMQSLQAITLIECPFMTEKGLAAVIRLHPKIKVCTSQAPGLGQAYLQLAKTTEDFQLLLGGKAWNLRQAGETYLPLLEAAKAGDLETLQLLRELEAPWSLLNQVDNKGASALHYAVQNGHLALAEYLLKAGANPNAPDKDGKTPLHIAGIQGDKAIVQTLLNHGANVLQQTTSGQETVLHYAAQYGHKGVIECLLATPEALALLARGDIYLKLPLHQAAFHSNPAIIRLFLEKGQNPDSANAHGFTPLHFAAREGHMEVMQTLLAFNATPDLKNDIGDTPLEVAKKKGKTEAVKYLQSLPKPLAFSKDTRPTGKGGEPSSPTFTNPSLKKGS